MSSNRNRNGSKPARVLRARTVAGVTFTLALAAAAACYAPSESTSHSEAEGVTAAPPPAAPLPPVGPTTNAALPDQEAGAVIVAYAPAIADALQSELSSSGAVARQSSSFPASLQAVHANIGVTSFAPLLPAGSASQTALSTLRTSYAQRTSRALTTTTLPRLDAFFVVRFDPSVATVATAMAALAADPNVASVEPNSYVHASSINDPYATAAYDWGLAKVDAQTAWTSSNGTGAVVATIDTGVMATHPDLAANVLSNGYDYVNNDSNPDDDNTHGTHVAGIIAAVANNAIGVAGVAPSAKILAVKALDSSGQGSLTNLASAIQYAMNQGVDVINNSWGGSGRSPAIESLFQTAESLGIVVTAAAGNSNLDATGFFPANIEYGITVAASDGSDVKSSFSNFGVKVDVAAPGGIGSNVYATDILSTVIAGYTGAGIVTGSGGEKYAPLAGTSMATPFVSGLAALLVAKHPTWTVEQIKQVIRKGAVDVGTAGFDTASGYGRISASASLAITVPPPSAALNLPHNGDVVEGNTVPLSGFALPSPGASGSYILYAAAAAAPTAWTALTSSIAANVTDGALGTLNTLNYPDGPLSLRVVTTNGRSLPVGPIVNDHLNPDLESVTSSQAEDRNLVTVNNVYITQPTAGEILSASSFNVTGKVMGNLGFTSYTLAWAPGSNATTGFTTFTTSASQVAAGGTLGAWPLTSIPDGPVTLKLIANFSGQAQPTIEMVNVIIDHNVLAGWPAPVQDPYGFKSPKIVDLDHDGHGEVVFGSAVYNWDGSVRAGWTNNPGLGRTNSAVANIDSDANLEVLSVEMGAYLYDSTLPNGGGPILKAYKHDKTPIWSYAIQNAAAYNVYNNATPSAVSIGDVDGDSRLEAVFSAIFLYNNGNYAATTVFVLDAATGTLLHSFNVDGRSWSSVAIANVDNAGKADLVLDALDVTTNVGSVYAMTGAGVALAGWPQSFTTDITGYGNIDPVVGDVDRDCHPDILIGQRLFKHDGTLFTGWPIAATADSAGAIANVDSDSAYELITGESGHVLEGVAKGNGTIASSASDLFGESLTALWIGYENVTRGNPTVVDLDGDGAAEILRASELGTAVAGGPVTLYDLVGSTGANHATYDRFVTPTPAAIAGGGYGGYPIYSTSAVGDLNGDGKIDLVVSSGGLIYAWGMGGTYTAANNPWPMFQHDLANTGTGSIAGCRILPPPLPIAD